MNKIRNILGLVLLVGITTIEMCRAQEVLEYQKPSETVMKLLSNPTLQEKLSPDKKYVLTLESSENSEVFLSEGEIHHLAGIKFEAKTQLSPDLKVFTAISIKEAGTQEEVSIAGMPQEAFLLDAQWSPNSRYVALVMFEGYTASLWLVDLHDFSCKRLLNRQLGFSLVSEKLIEWEGGSQFLICAVKSQENIEKPIQEKTLKKPVIHESTGQRIVQRSYHGLLKSEFDERMFDFIGSSQLVRIGVNGLIEEIGQVGILLDFDISPDGQYVKAHFAKKPYSFNYTVHRFPSNIEIFQIGSESRKEIQLSAVTRPLGRDAAYDVPRGFQWRSDQDASLFWVEALDGGDPERDVKVRDRVVEWGAPFEDNPKVIANLGNRFDRMYWINDSLAVVTEKWWKDRRMRWLLLNPVQAAILDTLTTYSSDSYFEGPGRPMWKKEGGRRSLLFIDDCILVSRNTYDEEHGVLPVLEKWNIFNGERKTVWKSSPPYFETAEAWVGDYENVKIIISRQGQRQPRHLVMLDLKSSDEAILTKGDVSKELLMEGVIEQELEFRRSDGVTLQATLYYHKDSLQNRGKLPGLVYAYPVDFQEKEKASEVFWSPYFYAYALNFQKILAFSGIAVLDYASFPVIAEGGNYPNDYFLEQIQLNAIAIAQASANTSVVDTTNMAVMGHSYGAFLVANLLTHSKLFKTGVALSGAYNRSLTPFGFQREYRTYWEAQELYHNISPFQQANKLQSPILLIHGEDDNNHGTQYQQSVRYYEALKGLGKTVRFVSLPYEGHVYQRKESKAHVYWEIDNWLQKHLRKDEKFFSRKEALSEEGYNLSNKLMPLSN
ncbi:alpha/beta hydrolase family protein [Belliella marina]|uniref:Alpha/beta hydrolase family protein n=1 Tax=Belliella marina TaxID=1644146 RepID=A0ABW4VHB4_9BACT